MDLFVLILYNLALLPVFAYSIGQLSLIVVYLVTGRQRLARRYVAPILHRAEWPPVTVQLPVYNERYVVERLIDAVVNLHYPAGKLEIQVLDDSTDETIDLIARRVAQYQRQGIAITHLRRSDRSGFKAGALAYGLERAEGEFVAIFDADFVPDPQFLRQTIPHFRNPVICAVQTRWTHLNEAYSLLTRIQGFGLDAHFVVEQDARNAAGLFMNFNGTAGIWRKTAITDAGGWRSDTLTEDLDLSYRAQLRGWQFVYRDDIGSPAELPVTMDAVKSQQYRWMKGAAECARLLLRPLLLAPNVSLVRRMHGMLHLLSSTMFVLMCMLSVLSVPVLFIRHQHPNWTPAYGLMDAFQGTLLVSLLFYGIPGWQHESAPGARLLRFAWCYPLYVALMLGLSWHNSLAVIAGYLGRKTPFVRTPKFNVTSAEDSWAGNVYLNHRVSYSAWMEGVLCLYFVGGIGLSLCLTDYRMLVFHALLAIGYGLVCFYSVGQHRPGLRLQRPMSAVEMINRDVPLPVAAQQGVGPAA